MVTVHYEKNPLSALNISKESSVSFPLAREGSQPWKSNLFSSHPEAIQTQFKCSSLGFAYLFGWVFLMGMIEPFITIISSCCWFPIFQSGHWLFSWRWISPLWQQKLMSFEEAEGVSVKPLQTMQCWARNTDVWQQMVMQQTRVVTSALSEASVCVQGKECPALLRYSHIQG